MEQLDHPDWLSREYDYRAGVSVEDMAERYGVSIYRVRAWYEKFNWERNASSVELIRLQLKRILYAAHIELMRGDLDDCNKRLKTISAFLKVFEDVDNFGRTKVGKAMHDREENQGENIPSLEDLRNEIERRLDGIARMSEKKSATGGDPSWIDGSDDSE